MITIDALKQFGADTDTGLQRCMGNEALYLRLVGSVVDEAGFSKLEQALGEKDLDNAFEVVHALKGVLGNLSLTPLYDKASEITELLRDKKDIDYSSYIKELTSLRDELKKLAE